MPDNAVIRPVDLIIGRGLLTAESIAAELRSRLVNRLARQRGRITDQALIELARRTLAEFEPLLAATLAQTTIAAWIAGAAVVAGKIPSNLQKHVLRARKSREAGILVPGSPTPPERGSGPPGGLAGDFGGDGQPVRFPLIERAAEYLGERRLVDRRAYEAMTAQGRHDAFSVTYHDSVNTLDHIRRALRETVEDGASLRVFRQKLGDAMQASPVGPGHVETVYRTNVQSAYHDGHETLAQDPIVSEIFPYQEYHAIHDARVTPSHLAMETLGLDGTNVYRRDDPVWDRWTPPNNYNCRCATNILTVRAAAARGVREAKEWLRTGRPPETPEWRDAYVPENESRGFGARARPRLAA